MKLSANPDPPIENAHLPSSQEMRVSVLRYRRLFEAARDGIFLLDIDTLTITDANPFMTELLGYTRDEFIGKEPWEFGFFSDKEASKDAFKKLQDEGYLRYDDLPLKAKNGDLRDVEFVSNVYDEGGVEVIQCNLRDITDRKSLEENQAATQERFQILFEYAPDGILIASPDNYYLEANASICRMLGYTREELIGLHAENIVIRSEVKDLGAALDEVHAGHDHYRVWHFRRKDGAEFPGEVLVTEMPDGNLLAMIRDITERTAAEEKLSRSQINLAKAQQIAHLGSWELDLPLKHDGSASPLRWSDEVFRIFGYQPGEIEVSNENFFLAAHPDDRENIKTAMAEALREGRTYGVDHRIILPDGTERIVHERAEIVFDQGTGEPLKMIGTVQDISERKRIERELVETAASKAESLAMVDTILDNAPIGFAFHDCDLAYVRINETLAAINGLSIEQHLGRKLREVVPQMAPLLEPIMEKVISTGKAVVDFEIGGESQAEPGKPKHWLASFYPVRMEGGQILGVGVLVSEVTERKKADKALRESEERYRDLVENAIDVIYTLDLHGNYTSMNRAGERLSGFTREASLTRNIADSIVPEYREKALQMIQAQIDGQDISAFEIEILNKEGRRIALEVNTRAIKENGVTVGVQGIARDMTERKKNEAELHRQRIELRTLFDYIPAMICFKDTKNGIVRANKKLALMAGKSIDEIEGRSTEEIFPEFAAKYFADDLEVINSGVPKLGIVETTRDADGNDITIQTDKIPMFDIDGQVNGLVVMATDITERMRDEDKLRESEERFAGAFELAPIGVALVLPSGQWLKVNRALCSLTGYTESELLGLTSQDITHPDDVDRDVVNSQRLLDGKIANYQMEKRYVHKLGHVVFGLINVSLVRDGEGNARYFISQIQDITERKQSENSLRESESLLAATQRITHLGSWVMDLQSENGDKNHKERWSDEHYRIFGFEPGQIEPTDELFYKLIHPDDRERLAATVREAIAERRSFDIEHRIILPDGGERVIQAMAEMVFDEDTGVPLKLLGSVQDITERKKAEADRQKAKEELVASEERYRSVVETAPDAILTIDDASTICFVNPAAERIFGFGIDEMKGASLTMLMPEYFRKLHASGIERYQRTGIKHVAWDYVELTGLHKSGKEIPITISFSEFIQNGRRFFTGIIRDISERKQVMEALRESEEQYRELVENAHDIIYSHDLAGNYTSINKAAEHITGYTTAEALQMNLVESVAPDHIEKAREMIARKLRGESITAYELVILAKDGHRVTLEVNTKLIMRDGVATGIQGVARDVTERNSLQEQLLQSQKLESLGRLAGGIAHDFNNMLTAINGGSDLILRELGSGDPLRTDIVEIKKAGERAAMLTSQLLAFSRQQILQSEVININETIFEVSSMLKRLIGEDIELVTVLSDDLGSVRVDRGQLSQILINLAVNAKDAMPDGGKLTIETSNRKFDREYVRSHVGAVSGECVMLSVTDTGVGIDNDIQEQIFEPFFTTKRMGKGTGLGLATVYGIVKQSGGAIYVYSEPGQGATFKIFLPLTDDRPDSHVMRDPSQDFEQGDETILLVEDEELVRTLTKKMLEICGYTVIEAVDGVDALRICETTNANPDLLITDIVMPRMGGRELAQKLHETFPRLPVLFASGYTDDAVVRHGILETNSNFIQKPFVLDDVARKIRKLLDNIE